MKKLKSHPINWMQIERFLLSAEKKLAAARKILDLDEEACLEQSYEAMLKASLGFMFSHGFRARTQPGHSHSDHRIRALAHRQETRSPGLSSRSSEAQEKPGTLLGHRICFSTGCQGGSTGRSGLPRRNPC